VYRQQWFNKSGVHYINRADKIQGIHAIIYTRIFYHPVFLQTTKKENTMLTGVDIALYVFFL
jgi:hypothetical protein